MRVKTSQTSVIRRLFACLLALFIVPSLMMGLSTVVAAQPADPGEQPDRDKASDDDEATDERLKLSYKAILKSPNAQASC